MALLVKEYAGLNDPLAIVVYNYLADHVLTEESTDVALAFISSKIKLPWLPFVGSFVINKVLDPLVPEKILELIKYLIIKANLATEEDFLRVLSPLRPR